MDKSVTQEQLYFTIEATSQILSWTTDSLAMRYAHESGGYRGGPDEPSWLQHLHRAQGDLSLAMAELYPPGGSPSFHPLNP
jgi:hypothetical protein